MVIYGFTFLSRFQFWTQIVWAVLQIAAIVAVAGSGSLPIERWFAYAGRHEGGGAFDPMLFCSAAAIVFALVAQNAEQVDFLRFLPRRRKGKHLAWWAAVICAGPGWVVPGIIKMLLGSFFVVLLMGEGMAPETAAQPTQMYLYAFGHAVSSPELAVALTGIFVVISQLKINVTNAYAGSLAWSNFFSRLTHSHPGRVVWLVFNVTLALLLMELGIYEALERTLGLYSNIPVAWMSVIAADLAIAKPLGLSPRHIEFKRAYLYDVNPVGVGAMILASAAAIATYAGAFGQDYHGLAPFVALAVAFLTVPLLAFVTKGRFYSARPRADFGQMTAIQCCICEHSFEPEDMAGCPVYSGPICSLCCSLDARCHDACKDGASLSDQWRNFLAFVLPKRLARHVDSRLARYAGLLLLFSSMAAAILSIIHIQMAAVAPADAALIAETLKVVFAVLVVVIAIAIWPFLLAKESGFQARQETTQQTAMLLEEIEAHGRTDLELQKAKEIAEARSLAKSKYVRGISHELRTPLNAVLGYAQLLEANKSLPAPLKRGIQVIRRSGAHLSSLVDGLLDISMIEAGRLQIHRDEIILDDFLNQLVDMLSLQAQERGLKFTFERPPHLPPVVRTDEKRLQQVLINLLQNAMRFTRAGRVSLRLSYSSEVAKFEIEDTGIGIAPEDLERIFLPFERLEGAVRTAQGGTGLGLTITKLLIEAMGGEVTVRSVPGEGSCFTVRLLLASVPQPVRAPDTQRKHPAGYSGRRRTVLVADDDPDHVAVVREALAPLGFIVLTAETGIGCLEAARRHDIDAVLLDISMPGLDGWEVARQLREDDAYLGAIIMISADARLDVAQAGRRYHDAYLNKPLQIIAMLDSIKALMELEWIYGAPGALDRPLAGPPPSPERLRQLRASAERGHVRGVLETLDAIGAEQQASSPVIAHLRQLAEDCDLDAFRDAIDELAAHAG